MLEAGKESQWPMAEMARTLRLKTSSLEQWKKRQERPKNEPRKRGRRSTVSQRMRWTLRTSYLVHLREWGATVLSSMAFREGWGSYSPTTIGRVIADLRPEKEKKAKPRRYEVAGSMVMWSEDGTGFMELGRKHELLTIQDEHARYTTNRRLVNGPAREEDVADYLQEAFVRHGAPLVLKQDSGSALNSALVKSVCDRWGVVLLNSPPHYPQFNGKKERHHRDLKSYVRALERHRMGSSLLERIDLAIKDLNDDRPRPVLKGRTAHEVFVEDKIALPDRIKFRNDVETRQKELESQAGSRVEIASARRRAVMEVLSRYGLLNWTGDVSTDFQTRTGAN